MSSSESGLTFQRAFRELVGCQLFKTWNVFATRYFYFAKPSLRNDNDDGAFRIQIECPWRIEGDDRIIVGSEDYGIRADDNTDPAWDPTETQLGHRQDRKLEELLGEDRNGTIFNTRDHLNVEWAKVDQFGGFQLGLSGGFTLSVFPATDADTEWLLSRRIGGTIALANGQMCQVAESDVQELMNAAGLTLSLTVAGLMNRIMGQSDDASGNAVPPNDGAATYDACYRFNHELPTSDLSDDSR